MSPVITFERYERECSANEERRRTGDTRSIVYDFRVFVDGEERGSMHRLVYGRGYQLYDLNHTLVGQSWNHCERQALFEDYVREHLPLLPTVEQAFWNAMRDGELRQIEHMMQQAREEQCRFGKHGWELLQASKQLRDAVGMYWRAGTRDTQNRAIAVVEVAQIRMNAAIAKAEAE